MSLALDGRSLTARAITTGLMDLHTMNGHYLVLNKWIFLEIHLLNKNGSWKWRTSVNTEKIVFGSFVIQFILNVSRNGSPNHIISVQMCANLCISLSVNDFFVSRNYKTLKTISNTIQEKTCFAENIYFNTFLHKIYEIFAMK